MKKMIKRVAYLLVLIATVYGFYAFHQLQIFEPIHIQLISEPQVNDKSINNECRQIETEVPAIEQTRFRLLSWNIHKGEDKGWQEDLSRFAQHQDFVLLQEATPKQKIPGFSTALFVASFAYQGNESGVKTFTHFPPQEYCGIAQAEPWIQIPKVASIMRFPLKDGRNLLLVNVHLINFEWNMETYRAQVEQIFSLIARDSQSAVIFAGDFNAWNDERKTWLNNYMEKAGFTEVLFSPDERAKFLGNPLDYVFARGMNAISSKTQKVESSDHSPIFVELEIK